MIDNKRDMISVIIPVYNVEKWLRLCVESITHQTYKNLEIILVEDGSPDNCGKICDQLAKEDERIIVFHKNNGGLSDARNCGLDVAKGSYICFVDSDDYLEPRMLEKLMDDITKENAEIAVCNYIYEYERSLEDSQDQNTYQISEKKIMTGDEFIRLEQQKNAFCVVVWNKLYSKEIFKEIRFPVEKIHEDEFIFHKIVYPCKRIICDPYIGYHYRLRKDSLTGKGGNSWNRVEAFSDRCKYFIENNNKDLALISEKKFADVLKTDKLSENRKEAVNLIQRCFHLENQLYQKGWISFFSLGIKWIQFFCLRTVIVESRRSIKIWVSKSDGLNRLLQQIKTR